MRVLIAGCGYLGSELARRLVSSGARVWGLNRRPAGLARGVEPLARDLAGEESLAPLPGVDVLVYCAAPEGGGETGYRRIYVDGLRNLLGSLPGRPRRVIFTSSTAVYGQEDGSIVDERSPTEPKGYRGRILLEAESAALASGAEAIALRLSGIYGPGRHRLLDEVRRGDARYQPGRYSNRIHRDDAARALFHLISLSREDADSVYVGSDREPTEQKTILAWLAARTGRPAPQPASEPSSARVANKRCSSDRLVNTGFRFLYPTFREGFEKILNEESLDHDHA